MKKEHHNEIHYFKLNEFFPIDKNVENRLREFVLHIKDKSHLSDEDLIYVITRNDFIFLIGLLVKEYEDFIKTNPISEDNENFDGQD